MILSIDTFSETLGIALIDESKEIKFFVNYRKPKPFSEVLIYKIDQLFKEFSIEKSDIKGIAVNKGPGAYTGLRIGITTAKVLSYTLYIPLYTYESLYTMAYAYRYYQGSIVSLIYAGKGEVYFRRFKSDGKIIKPITDNLIIKKTELEKLINPQELIIEKNLNLKSSIKLKTSLAFEGALIATAQNKIENPFLVEPVYLRKT